jgi:hypothetical protein
MKVEKIKGTLVEVDYDNNQVAITPPGESKDHKLYNVDGIYLKKDEADKKVLEALLLQSVIATLKDDIIVEINKEEKQALTKDPSAKTATKP